MVRGNRASKTGISKHSLRLNMSTKEKLSTRPKPDTYFCQDIPIKVRRALVRRQVLAPPAVSPVCFTREASLSPLYQKDVNEKYIHQVFTSLVKIGQGCFGDVFRAQSQEDSRMYAIKVTNDTHISMDKGEVRRLEKVPPHKNCVEFFGAWQENFRLYIQMELCTTSLDKFLLVYRQIDERRSWEIFIDIALGLQHLHKNELIHFDLKPANVMICSNGVCKLGDFGLVVDLREMIPNDKPLLATVSEGDGKYVALEVLHEIYTKAADIFSLGLLMLETVTDVALPKSGPDWVRLREGALPTCYDECDLSSDFRKLLESMLLKDHLSRPDITKVLQAPSAIELMQIRDLGNRLNIMGSWDQDYTLYLTNHPNDIPCIQVEGPSPPRRTYPINYVPRLETPRVPLQDITSSPNHPPVEDLEAEYARARNLVARRLF